MSKGMTLPTGNLVSSTTLPQILHSLTASSIPSTKQLPHQHGWIQPCTGKPLGFLTGREGRRVSTSRGETLIAHFPRDPCAAVVDDASHLRKGLLMNLMGF